MASETDPQLIVLEVEIAAPPETVFAFLADPTRMRRWIGVAVELDPRPGGVLEIDVNGRDVVRGRVIDVDPPRLVAFTWGWDRPDAALPAGASRVEITLEPVDGGTRLRLRHSQLPPEVREEHAAGWEHYLVRLRVAATGGDPGPDPLATRDILHGEPGSRPTGAADARPEDPDTPPHDPDAAP